MLFLTCHRLSIRFPEVCWYQSVGMRGRIVQDHHQQAHQVYHEQTQPAFDYADPATLWTLWVARDSDPAQHDQSGNVIRWIGQLTGTRDGNASSVILEILFIKFIADVLQSSASSRKWSRTSKVNAVLGFLKLAGKSFARRRSSTYWSADLAQWHHRIDRLKIPVDDTMISLDRDPKCVVDPELPEGWCPSGKWSSQSSSASSDTSGSNIIWFSGIDGQSSG